MNYLNGPFLAYVFPETDSRQFTLENSVYWIQHALMWIIPGYLLRVGGMFVMSLYDCVLVRFSKIIMLNRENIGWLYLKRNKTPPLYSFH